MIKLLIQVVYYRATWCTFWPQTLKFFPKKHIIFFKKAFLIFRKRNFLILSYVYSKTLTYLEPDAYLGHCKTSAMERFAN